MTILWSENKIEIPKKYEKKFLWAFLTFKFQRVFCPQRRWLVHIFDPAMSQHGKDLEKFKKLNFLGEDLSEEIVQNLALGDIDPITKEKFKDDENEKYIVKLAL